jgi:ribosomal protein S12 methylthiotransferase
MNRKGDAETYLSLIDSIRSALPEATIRSTFLVGFPGETEGDMDQLLDFQQRARIDWLGAFEYSREEGTPAFNMKARVSKKLAFARRKRIEEAQATISEERMERFVGKNLRVLVEEKVEGEEGLYLGRAACQAPEVDGAVVLSSGSDLECGTFQQAHVFRRAGLDLDAARIPPPDSCAPPAGV